MCECICEDTCESIDEDIYRNTRVIMCVVLKMLVVVGKFDLPWGETLDGYFSAFSIFFLNFDLSLHACNMNLSYETTWFLYALFPEIWVLCLAVRFLFQYTATRVVLLIVGKDLSKWPIVSRFAIKDVNMWWALLWDDALSISRKAWGPSVANCLSTYACQSFPSFLQKEFPSGYVTKDPTLLCYQDYHLVLVVVAAISLAKNLVIFPLYTGYQVYKIGPKGRMLSKDFQRRFGFVYLRYEPKYFWFEIIGASRFLSLLLTKEFLFDHSKYSRLGEIQALAALLVTFGYVTILFFTTPFQREENDLLEAGLQTCFFLTIACGLFQASDTEGSNHGRTAGILVSIRMCAHLRVYARAHGHLHRYSGCRCF